MQVEGIPTNGCLYLNSSTTFTHYLNGTATSYVIMNDKAIKTRTSSYSTMPTGYQCVEAQSLTYKPELEVYFPIISFCIILLLTSLIYKMIIKRLMP